MKLLIITMGPGETSQGLAIGKYFQSQGEGVSFIVTQKKVLNFFNAEQDKIFVDDPEQIKKKINSGYDAVILCNSKIFSENPEFQNNPPSNKPKVFSLDSNWLFDQPEKYPFVKWLDNIFLNFPPKVYENGLKENGGRFIIPQNIKNKIINVGAIPSYKTPTIKERFEVKKSLGLSKDQKLIFCYIGSGSTFRNHFLTSCIEVFDQLFKKHQEFFKILFVQNPDLNAKWLIPNFSAPLMAEDFYKYLSAADLIFQHQGLGTIEQAISARVPVIANVSKPNPEEKINAHAWEVSPFEKAGLCKMHYFSDQVSDIIYSIEELLFFDPGMIMRKNQAKNHSRGEEVLYQKVRELTNE